MLAKNESARQCEFACSSDCDRVMIEVCHVSGERCADVADAERACASQHSLLRQRFALAV